MSTLIRLSTNPPSLPPNVVHESTDWEIATDPNFNNIIEKSYNDTINLTEFTTVVDQIGPYYARSRVRLSAGTLEWSNIVVCGEDIFIQPPLVFSNIYGTDYNDDTASIPILNPEIINMDWSGNY